MAISCVTGTVLVGSAILAIDNPPASPTTRSRDLRRDARPRPKLATRPATRARNHARNPLAPRHYALRPFYSASRTHVAGVELLGRFASRNCGCRRSARARPEPDWAIVSKDVLDIAGCQSASLSRVANRAMRGPPLLADPIFCTVAGSCRIVAGQLPDSCRLCFTQLPSFWLEKGY